MTTLGRDRGAVQETQAGLPAVAGLPGVRRLEAKLRHHGQHPGVSTLGIPLGLKTSLPTA